MCPEFAGAGAAGAESEAIPPQNVHLGVPYHRKPTSAAGKSNSRSHSPQNPKSEVP